MKYNIELQAHAFVRTTIEVEAKSHKHAIDKVKRQLEIGDEPGVQNVSDVSWQYDGLCDDFPIELK